MQKHAKFRPFPRLAAGIRPSQSVHHRFSALLFVCGLAGLLLMATIPSFAQVNTASLRGTVLDSAQLATAGAQVSIQNKDTAVVRATVTNDAGEYSAPGLDPGTYEVTVTKPGFSTVKSTLNLEVAQVANLNFTLRVGQVSEIVDVSALSSEIETTDVSLGEVIGKQQIVDLPLNGRQFSQLLSLQPGTVPVDSSQIAGKAPSFGAGAVSPGVNGQVNRSNIFFLDGMLASNPFFGGFSFSPSVDDIQEFKEQSHTDQAEFGQSVGAQVTVVSRPGTNTYHGAAFEFLRNNAFDARNYFASTRLPYHQNQFGASFGGPILKNKLFFFANYEGGRQIQGQPSFSTVPTAAERMGNFSGFGPDGVTPIATLYDPSTFNPVTFTESTFSGNQIPVDTGMLALLNGFYPGPNFVPTGSNPRNFLTNTGNIANADQGSLRVDYNVSAKDIINGRYSQNESENNQQSALANRFVTGFNGKLAGGNWLHTYGPSLISQVTVSYNSLNIPQAIVLPVDEAMVFADSGVGAGFNAHPGGDPVVLAPAPNLNGGSYSGFWNGAGPIGPMHILQFSGSVAKISGKHNLKFGGSFYKVWMYTNWNGNSLSFSQKATWNAACQFVVGANNVINNTAFAQCPTLDINPSDQNFNDVSAVAGGDPAASMLLSLPDGANRNLGNSGVNLRQNTTGLFAQDSWSITPRLTMNYGIRWDYTSPMTEDNNRLGTYNTQLQQYQIVKGDTDLPSGPLPPNVAILSRSSITTQHYNWFSPRVGFAYQLTPKTTLRLGAGHAYDNWGESLQVGQQNRGNWPSGFSQNASATPINSAGITYISPGVPASGQNPFSTPAVLPASPLPGAGGLGVQEPGWVPAGSWQWNAEVEQNLGAIGNLSVAYVGSKTNHTAIAFPYNLSQPQPTSATEFFPDQVLGVPLTILVSQGNSKYNSLQAKLTRSFSSGFSYNASFTWSKSTGLDSCNGDTDNVCTQNPYTPSADYGPTFLDVPLIFTFNTLYELPFGKGRPYMQDGAAAAILGNWQVNSIILARSGTVVNPQTNSNTANNGGGTQRAQRLSDPESGAPHKVGEWWNTSALGVPAAGSFGDAGLNSLRGPHYVNVDFSVFRDFPLTERAKLQFRFEAFDLFNHPNFGNPNNSVGSNDFGKIFNTFNTGGNRDIQFALKLLF